MLGLSYYTIKMIGKLFILGVIYLLQVAFPNQKIAANEIFTHFTTTALRYGLLRASLQAGKTGTYQHLMRKMFKKNIIDRAYILCGSHEIELLNQVRQDVKDWFGSSPYAHSIEVIFRQDFHKKKMTTRRALIVVDESHLVSGTNQTLNQFLMKHGLSMAGTTDKMIREETYLLSVDATPYAEESAMSYGNSNPKFRVVLQNGDGYYGIKDYHRDGLLNKTFCLSSTEGKSQFIELLQDARFQKKYILIRIHEKGNNQYLHLMECIRTSGCNVRHFTSQYKNETTQLVITQEEANSHLAKYGHTIPCLEVAPTVTTVVLLDGRLRCGKRTPKKHIGVVWEMSKKSNTETILQSLPGRMCGHEGDGIYDVPKENRPLLFVPPRQLKMRKECTMPLSDLQRHIVSEIDHSTVLTVPKYGNHLLRAADQRLAKRGNQVVTPCIPIRFMLSAEAIDYLATSQPDQIKLECLTRLTQLTGELIESHSQLTPDQKEEIKDELSILSPSGCHLRNYDGTSNQGMHKAHTIALRDQTSSLEHISDYHFLTFCVTYPGFQPMPGIIATPGEVFAIFYTYAEGFDSVIPKESRIACHDGKTHFSKQIMPEMQDCPAGGIYGFTPAILRDSNEFYKQFDKFIRIAQDGIGLFDRRFTSLYQNESILLPRSIYGTNLEILNHIISKLEEKHHVIIRYQAKRSRIIASPNTNITLQWIEWTPIQ